MFLRLSGRTLSDLGLLAVGKYRRRDWNVNRLDLRGQRQPLGAVSIDSLARLRWSTPMSSAGALLSGVAATGHVAVGKVEWPLLPSLLVGSMPGVIMGSRLAAAG